MLPAASAPSRAKNGTTYIHAEATRPLARKARASAGRIDILIDLGGYRRRLAHVRLRAAGWHRCRSSGSGREPHHRPARHGLDADRSLGDAARARASLHRETCWVMPDGYSATARHPMRLMSAPLPALANGHVTFGCFNNLAKVTPRVIATWARVLHRVPGSRMVLKTHQFTDAGTRSASAQPSPAMA